jgi:hypothetical protein
VRRPRRFSKIRLAAAGLMLALAIPLAGCSDAQKLAIRGVMNARDQAISHKDIRAYSRLLLTDYHDHGRNKVDVVTQMMDMFDRFDQLDMHSFNRVIRVLDGTHAQCEQSYRLRVRMHQTWRTIVDREQLQLQKTADGWKISAGL